MSVGIQPVQLDLPVQRNASFPTIDPFTVFDELTGQPIDISGATFRMEVRMYEGEEGDALIDKSLPVIHGPSGTFEPPAVTKAEHQGLVAASANMIRDRQSVVRFRYDIVAEGVVGWPDVVVIARGDYPVQTGVTL